MMKIVLVSACFLGFVAHAVVVPSCPLNDMRAQKSFRHVQITAQAKPLKGTKIDFYSYKLGGPLSLDASTLRFSFVTDEKGRIKTPELPAGGYFVVANGPDHVSASLLINVVPDTESQTTNFTMHLCVETSQPPPPPQWTPADEEIPIQKRVPVFRGTVKDQSGAVIPGALIDIVKKGTEGKEHVAQLEAGSDGGFSGELPPGFYIGFFYARGFKDQIIPFEITKEGTGDIDVVMPIPSPSLAITKLDLPKNAQTN